MRRSRTDLADDIERDAKLDRSYVALASAACAIASFGLLENSVAVIIGAMLIDWLSDPIRIDLLVRAQSPVTSTQVGFLQQFAERSMRRRVRLVVDVSPISAVTADPQAS